ncbi:YtxH domain-containing protein [Lacticigenium naphthae]|uniref:YtxH domain-containing protein n=1 Tax=Lacticigenium naphthae TaxID=515351 RepID=UPI0004159458|nr:YtxH domain-containing protein [Lacticigenium naphthae]
MGKREEGFFLGTIIGAVLAGVTVLLFTPKSGKELRGDISHQTELAKDSAKDYIDIAKEKSYELKENAQKTSEEYKKTASEKVDLMKDKVKEATQYAKEDLEGIKSEINQAKEDFNKPEKQDPYTTDTTYSAESLKEDLENRTMDQASAETDELSVDVEEKKHKLPKEENKNNPFYSEEK